MGLISKSNGVLGYKIILENLRGWNSRAKNFIEKDGLRDAATMLQIQSFRIMKATYMSTKTGEKRRPQKSISYTSMGRRYPFMAQSIEEVLFNERPSPVPLSNKQGYEIRMVHNYAKTVQKYPHLLWQERGTKRRAHKQAYQVSWNPKKDRLFYYNIREEEAQQLEGRQKFLRSRYKKRYKRDKKWGDGDIRRLVVTHPTLSPRNFIKKATTWLKTEGRTAATRYISQALRGK